MKILMVCLGNICRSPLAEGILKSKLPDYIVDSAGTISMHEGNHPDKRSVKVAALHNIDISKQRSRPIQPKDLESFDRIYCMDRNNLKDVSAMARNEEQKQKYLLYLMFFMIKTIPKFPIHIGEISRILKMCSNY